MALVTLVEAKRGGEGLRMKRGSPKPRVGLKRKKAIGWNMREKSCRPGSRFAGRVSLHSSKEWDFQIWVQGVLCQSLCALT